MGSRERGQFGAPGAGRIDDRRGMDVAPVRADAAHRAVRGEQYVRDGPAGEQPCAGGADEVGGGQCGHDLAVLRIEHPAGQTGGEVRFEVVQPVSYDGFGGDPGGALCVGEPLERDESVRRRGDDHTALGLVLDGLPSSSARSAHRRPDSRARSSSGPGSLSETRRLPSPAPVVPPATGPRSTVMTSRPARAAYRAQAAPTIPAPTTTTSQVSRLLTAVLCHIPLYLGTPPRRGRRRGVSAAGAPPHRGAPRQTRLPVAVSEASRWAT